MITRGPLHLLRLFALLLLATIGLQALTPQVLPFERGHGSAFSSGTLHVAVVSSDRTTVGKTTAGKAKFTWTGPLDGPPPCVTCRSPAPDGSESPPQPIGPVQRPQGPSILDLIPSPRAPPAS